MEEQPNQRRYFSYLLRLWQTSDKHKQIWQASLESPGSRERQGFASLEDLFDFLEAETGQSKAHGKTRDGETGG